MTRDWGKQRINYQTFKDWNNLDPDTRNSRSTATFKCNFLNQFYNTVYFY